MSRLCLSKKQSLFLLTAYTSWSHPDWWIVLFSLMSFRSNSDRCTNLVKSSLFTIFTPLKISLGLDYYWLQPHVNLDDFFCWKAFILQKVWIEDINSYILVLPVLCSSVLQVQFKCVSKFGHFNFKWTFWFSYCFRPTSKSLWRLNWKIFILTGKIIIHAYLTIIFHEI